MSRRGDISPLPDPPMGDLPAPVAVELHDVRFYGGTRSGIDAQCTDCDPIWLDHIEDGRNLADLGRFVAKHSRSAKP